MLREVWRLQRDQFWVADMSGIDWDAVYARYAPLVERVSTRAELSDLIWEMQGELGTSHAYEMGGDHRKPPQVALGYLGAELRRDADRGGYEIARIVPATPGTPARLAAHAVGVEAAVGERIVAVNGQPDVARATAAGAARAPGGDEGRADARRRSTAPARATSWSTTLADEVPARYREWVERNRAWVHARRRAASATSTCPT